VKVVPAIAAGCTAVLKPGNQAPLSVFQLVDALHEERLPAGVLRGYKRSGYGRELGRAGFEEYLRSKSIQLPS
jgi:betaine-aldehyde dehydrogenase